MTNEADDVRSSADPGRSGDTKEAEIDYDEADYRSIVIFGSFATKLSGPQDLVLTREGHWAIEEAVEESLREDGVIRGLCMTTGIYEVLHSLEEARDECISKTLKQPPEIGRLRGWVLSALLKAYRAVRRGVVYPGRY